MRFGPLTCSVELRRGVSVVKRTLLAWALLVGAVLMSAPARLTTALTPETSFHMTFSANGQTADWLCEGSGGDVYAGPLQAGDVVHLQASASGNPNNYPADTTIAFVGDLALKASGATEYEDFVAEEGQGIRGCVDTPGITVTVDGTINHAGKMVTAVEVEGENVVRDCDQTITDDPPCSGDFQRADQFRTTLPCDLLLRPRVQWRDCGPNPDDTTEMNWPVMVQAGHSIQINYVRLEPDPAIPIKSATISGHGFIHGVEFNLPATDAVIGVGGSGQRIVTATNLQGGNWPIGVGRYMLTIAWHMDIVLPDDTTGGFDAGGSSQPVYVMLHAHTPVSASVPLPGDRDQPFMSLVALSVQGADGILADGPLRDSIWNRFTDRQVHRYHLDPRNGAVTLGGTLKFYPDWSFQTFQTAGFGPDRGGGCATSLASLLNTGVGRCSHFSMMLASMLHLHGLDGQVVALWTAPGWAAVTRQAPAGAQYMLIGRDKWFFSRPDPKLRLPLGYTHLFNNLLSLVGPQFNYDASGTNLAAQNTVRPPGLFLVGDHFMVQANGRFYDPSYGSGPFASVADWARASIAGWARAVLGCAPGWRGACIMEGKPY